MLIARKLRSAVRLYRRQGMPGVEEIARFNALTLYRSHRPIPTDATRRARMLSVMLNRWSGVSPAAVSLEPWDQVRDAVLVPYLRHRFAATVEAIDRADIETSLRPLEVLILADCLFELCDYQRIAASLQAWTAAVDHGPYAHRITQVGRRTALRMGRLTTAARDIERSGTDLASLLLRGEVYDALGRTNDASASLAAAVHRDGSNSYARLIYAFHLLKTGRLLEGLSNWSASDTLAGIYPLRRHRPSWAGEPLGARSLLVLFEHGFGDMIQMSRFLSRLRAREPEAIITGRVPAALAGLLARAFPTISIFTDADREPDYDLFVPSMQLPAVLGLTDLEPRNTYIDLGVPRPRHSSRQARFRIGVCWRGHPRRFDLTRSIPLDLFSSLFKVPGCDFVVLLNRITVEEEAILGGVDQVVIPQIEDFLDLAAEIAACDLVVSVDTAVPHLAAAGGVPVLLLSRPDACWRWGTAGDSPWYEAVEVLRHGGDLDWPGVLAEAALRIGQLAEASTQAIVGS